jgi:hypothetical protein
VAHSASVSARVYVATSRDKTYVSPHNGLHVVAGHGAVGADRYVASYSFDTSGIFTVTLEDGEVWQESSNWPTLANWKA